MLNFIRTTILGGIVFLLPIVIFIVVIGKAWKIISDLIMPLVKILPIDSAGELVLAHLAGLAILVAICFFAGLAARTRWAKRLVVAFEMRILENIPAYSLLKAKANSMLTPDDTKDMLPVMVRFDDSWQLGFEVEKLDGDKNLIYLPGSPDPWSGSVCGVTRDRVVPIDMNMRDATMLMTRLGKGSELGFQKAINAAQASAGPNQT